LPTFLGFPTLTKGWFAQTLPSTTILLAYVIYFICPATFFVDTSIHFCQSGSRISQPHKQPWMNGCFSLATGDIPMHDFLIAAAFIAIVVSPAIIAFRANQKI
jgi:hypothetical protein